MYVKEELQAVEATWKTAFPEHVWCRIKQKGSANLLVGVCYRTPTERLYSINLHERLRNLVTEISSSNIVLMGDFNYRSINWIDHSYEGSSLEAHSFLACVEDCMLTQHVLFPATDRSVLDLVITRDPTKFGF